MIAKQDDIPVEVNVYDFIGNKTGMFGMTRMGKSNTMKTVAARVFAVSERRRAAGLPPVGQLILDPQGEYANPNLQDGTELAAIGPEHVVIYKFGADGSQANVRPLGFNFFDPQQIEPVKSIISSALADAGLGLCAGLRPGRLRRDRRYRGSRTRKPSSAEPGPSRGRLILYGALARADFPIPRTHVGPEGQEWPWRAWVPMRKDLADELERQLGQGHIVRPQRGRRIGVERDSLIRVIDWLIERAEARDLAGNAAAGLRSIADGDPWKSALPIYTQVNQGRAVSGYTKLKPLKSFHTPSSRVDYRDEIYRELVRGKIVIVDLHLGPDATIRQLSENLAGHLMERQTEVFTSGIEPPLIQVALEEAHNLFSSERYKDDLDVWVRMAKQASKLKIGMLYATQEVTGVDHQVLANTKNWVVAHLNNSREVNELARFYDFKAFGDAIISHEDKGYVRLEDHVLPVHRPRAHRPVRDRARQRGPRGRAAAAAGPVRGLRRRTCRTTRSPAASSRRPGSAIPRRRSGRWPNGPASTFPAEHLRDLAWLRPKIRPKAGLPRPAGCGPADRRHRGRRIH